MLLIFKVSANKKKLKPPLDITKALNAIDIPGDKLHMTYYIDTRNIAEITLSRLLSEAGSTSADDNTMVIIIRSDILSSTLRCPFCFSFLTQCRKVLQ